MDKDTAASPRSGRARSPYPPLSSYDPYHDYHYFPPPSSTVGPVPSLPQPSFDSLESDWVAIKAQAFMKTGVVDVFGDSGDLVELSRSQRPPVTPRPDDVSRQQSETRCDSSYYPEPPAEIRSTWAHRVYKRIQGNKLRKATSATDLREPRQLSGAGEARRRVLRDAEARREYRQQLPTDIKHTALFPRSKGVVRRDMDSESDFGHDPVPEHRLSSHRTLTFDRKWAGDGADLGASNRGSLYVANPSAHSAAISPANALHLDGVTGPSAPSSHAEPEPPAPPVPPKDWQYLSLLNSRNNQSPLARSPIPQLRSGSLYHSPETCDDPLIQTPDLVSGNLGSHQLHQIGFERVPAQRLSQGADKSNLPVPLGGDRFRSDVTPRSIGHTLDPQGLEVSAWWERFPSSQAPSMQVSPKATPPPRPPRPDAELAPTFPILQRTPPRQPPPCSPPRHPLPRTPSHRSPPQVRIAPSPTRPTTATSRYRHFVSGHTVNRISAQFPVFNRKVTPPRLALPHSEENCPHQEEGLVCLRNHLAAEVLARHPTTSSTDRRCLEWSKQVEPGLPVDQRPPPLSPGSADAEMAFLGLLRSRLNINDDDHEGNDTLTIPSIPDHVETEYETARDQV
ncbi:uncharacterized protein LOC62_05G007547 [Vanrija pseudolonga]|uniref:Uncharacterized protein n=1 Tax=Vanrija pseudolonga TaxID=143232 RepID=A0AAF0YC75_9TREE|nr:hypothetical protein LOC62_05G007547 [Vanrija pseudolonga]